jgi:hypothetical protein
MPPGEEDPTQQAWELEEEDAFLDRVEQLVTTQADTMKRMRHLRELAILYEGRAQFLIELKERCEQALVPDSGVGIPDREELLELLAAHEEEVRAEWDATEPVPDITILEVLWKDDPPGNSEE